MTNINVKLLDVTATIPTKANSSDAGWDLYSTIDIVIPSKQRNTVKTGIALEIPENMAGLIWPRSGLSVKKGIDVLAGVIDSGYRGEIMVCLYNTSDEHVSINRGDRIAQIIFQEVPCVMMLHQEGLGSSQRGDNGFGSSGT
jgi:dUTP pyrophosphatase